MIGPRDEMVKFDVFGSAPVWRELNVPGTAEVSGFGQGADIELENFALGGLAIVGAGEPSMAMEPLSRNCGLMEAIVPSRLSFWSARITVPLTPALSPRRGRSAT